MTTKTTWEYSNGAYETNSITYLQAQGNIAAGQTVFFQRSILGPAPYTEPVIRNIVTQVDPQNNLNWQQTLTNLLAQERFFTQNIAIQRGRDIDFTVRSYCTSRHFLWNAAKASGPAAAILGLFFAPSLAAKIAPESMEILASDADETEEKTEDGVAGFVKKNAAYSAKVWWKILRSEVLSGSLLGGVVTIGGGTTLVALSKTLYDQLCKTLGHVEFQKWKTEKLAIFNTNKPIPDAFEADPVLANRVCAISNSPIRVPCILNCNHVFEEAMIRNWMLDQAAHRRTPACPLCRRVITNPQIDVNISDQIELRLFLLQARKANGL